MNFHGSLGSPIINYNLYLCALTSGLVSSHLVTSLGSSAILVSAKTLHGTGSVPIAGIFLVSKP